MTTINIVSVNVRGIRDMNKRRSIFNFYRPRCDILCIQETHSQAEDAPIWSNEWGGEILFNHGTTSARGVAILIKKTFKGQIEPIPGEDDGRSVACTVRINDKSTCIMNVYGPNKDSPMFYQEKINKLYATSSESIIVIGDFNVVMNHNLDRSSTAGKMYNVNAMQMLNELCDQLSLSDVWRSHNPDSRRYLWYKTDLNRRHETPSVTASRLDYALVSKALCGQVHDTFYLNGIHTDHSAFFLGIQLEDLERGPSYWKLNTSLLTNQETVEKIKSCINEVLWEYKLIDPCERWEVIKAKVKKLCQNEGRRTASEDQVAISNLCEKIVEMEDKIDQLTEVELKTLVNSKIDLDELQFKKTAGILFRSRAKWAFEGERNTQYFYNIERHRSSAKICTSVFDEDGNIVRGQENVMELQRRFYETLYKSDPDVLFQMPNSVVNKIPENNVAASEEDFDLKEIAHAVKNLRNGSCPGSDGL